MRSKGSAFEDIALKYLSSKGLTLVQQNYSCRRGEIDLIMRDNKTLIFIEVKYRKSNHFGSPLETITHSKQNKIIATARHFLSKKNLWHLDSRFDVVAISDHSDRKFEWIKGAFTSENA